MGPAGLVLALLCLFILDDVLELSPNQLFHAAATTTVNLFFPTFYTTAIFQAVFRVGPNGLGPNDRKTLI